MDEELKKLLEDQGKAFETFRKTNDDRLKDVETKGGAKAAEFEAKLATINADMDRLSAAIQEAAKKANRAAVSGHDGKQLTQEQVEHKQAFYRFLRKGDDAGLSALESKAMSVGSDPDGGYWVEEDSSGQIVRKIFETSDMRAIASVQTISTDSLEGATDRDEAEAQWVGEKATRSETATPKTGMWRIPVHEMYAEPRATQSLLDDSSVDIGAWLGGKVADKFARKENTAFFNGTGVGQPRGLLSYTTAATADATRAWQVFEHIATGTSGGFGTDPNGTDKLLDLVHKVKRGYRANGSFTLNKTTLGNVRKLKDGNGHYIWLPNMAPVGSPFGGTLLGYNYLEAEDMPDIAANSYSIAFGDFKRGYQIVDRMGIRVLRDPYTAKPFTKFYTTRRVGGDVLDFEAIKFLKFI